MPTLRFSRLKAGTRFHTEIVTNRPAPPKRQGHQEKRVAADDWIAHSKSFFSTHQYSDGQVAVAVLYGLGYSEVQIAEKTGIERSNVSRTLKLFPSTSQKMREAVSRLTDANWYSLIQNRKINIRMRLRENELLAQQGKWPYITVPQGYKITPGGSRILQIDKEAGSKISKLFYRVAAGDAPYAVYREEKLKCDPHTLYRILKNPVYRGYVRYKGRLHLGLHTPLVDEDTWEKANSALTGKVPVTKYGFRRDARERKIDEEKIPIIKKVWQLRLAHNSASQIGEEAGLPRTTVQRMLRDEQYKAIVGEDVFERARDIRLSHREVRQRVALANEQRILHYLYPEKKRSTSQIMVGLHLSEAVLRTLNRLRAKDLLERSDEWHGLYYLNANGRGVVKGQLHKMSVRTLSSETQGSGPSSIVPEVS